jgi:hypothetical protein
MDCLLEGRTGLLTSLHVLPQQTKLINQHTSVDDGLSAASDVIAYRLGAETRRDDLTHDRA